MGRKKKYTHKKYTLYNIFVEKKKKYIIESMNIALIVHFTPQTLRKDRGGGYVVSSSEMAGGKKKRYAKRALRPATAIGDERRKRWGERRCVCVLTFCRHSEKTGSSFQTPVQAKE